MFKQYKLKNYKFILVMYVVILNVIGILLIGSAKPSVQSKQIFGMIAGLTIMVMLSLIDYNFILKFSWLIYFFMIGVLLLVMFAGDDAGGAQRWFEIGGFRFQPSELAKILIILFFAYFFMKHEEKINTPKVLISSFILAGIPLALILKQPDLSTTIVTALIFAALLFVAGLSYKIVVGVLAVSIPSAVILFTLLIQDKLPFIKSYQVTRVMAWLYPDDYPADAYQQQNSIMAIGSGQLWGKGLNNTDATSVKNGNFIPEPQTDFIFAVAGEELGFIGTVIIIILLLFITIECILIARKAKDTAGKMICCGFAALVGFQSLVNIGVASGVLPNTASICQLWSYIASIIIYRGGACIECWTTAEKILTGGNRIMNIGLIAHDSKKKLMQNFCIAYRGILSKNELYATGTTGRLIEEVTNLNVHKYLAGHLGGSQQLGAQIEHNEIDLVIFLRDPLTPKSHEPDVNNVVKLCDTHNIPLATNLATAELLIRALDRGDLEWREMYK